MTGNAASPAQRPTRRLPGPGKWARRLKEEEDKWERQGTPQSVVLLRLVSFIFPPIRPAAGHFPPGPPGSRLGAEALAHHSCLAPSSSEWKGRHSCQPAARPSIGTAYRKWSFRPPPTQDFVQCPRILPYPEATGMESTDKNYMNRIWVWYSSYKALES